jgi:DUF1009 family protein
MSEGVTSPLGLIAGQGDLPRLIIAHCRESARPVFAIAIRGQTPPETVAEIPHVFAELGQAGAIIEALKRAHAHEVVMAGALRRPSLAELKPDWRGAKLLARGVLQAGGDDALLRLITEELEGEGFRVIGAQALVQSLLAGEGVWTRTAPDEAALADIRRGIEVTSALGALDIGQSAVVQQGIVLGVEAAEGTDALLARCGALAREGAGGVLVKCAKPKQERRVDLPTIGLETFRAAKHAGLRGIAVEAGGALVLSRTALVQAADAQGFFLCGVHIAGRS